MLTSATMLLLIDQWSKKTVQLLAPNRCIRWTPFLRVRYVTNLIGIYQRRDARSALVIAWCVCLCYAQLCCAAPGHGFTVKLPSSAWE
jgi:hypothetical protein